MDSSSGATVQAQNNVLFEPTIYRQDNQDLDDHMAES